MQVSEAESRLFHELHVGLQTFVNRRHRIVDQVDSFDDFMAFRSNSGSSAATPSMSIRSFQ